MTAGKKTAKTAQNPGESGAPRQSSTRVPSSPLPASSDTSESTIAAITTYWSLMAASAERSATAATSSVAATATQRCDSPGNVSARLSAKPIV